MDDFVPSEFIQRTIRHWWLLVLLMIIGGGAGVLVSRIQKPVYESQASITTSIDFAYTDRLNEDQEDYLIATVGDVISSDAVFTQLKQIASDSGVNVDDEMIGERFTKARQGYRWELSVRANDPQTAQKLTQIWVDTAGQQLAQMRERSLDSLKFHAAELALQNCFSQMVVLEPASGGCSLENLSEIRQALNSSHSESGMDSTTSAILLSRISTEITDNASLPVNPSVYKTNLVTLAGAVCGLLAGLVVLLLQKTVVNHEAKR